jgi:hypothetical protein
MSETLKCQECGTDVSQRVADFSAKNFGKILCISCQKDQEGTEPTPTRQTFSGVKTTEQVVDPRISKKNIITLQGKQFITHAGLLEIAHKEGLQGIETEILQFPTENTKNECIIKATVTMKDEKKFSGIGDANGTNVNRSIAPHLIRMAETRAVNRALRFATNIGMTSSEELGGDEKDQT